jgi:hypothetical protein
MSKCVICDVTIEQPTIDPRDLKVRPCRKCETVIQDCIDSFRDPNESDIFAYIDYTDEDTKGLL